MFKLFEYLVSYAQAYWNVAFFMVKYWSSPFSFSRDSTVLTLLSRVLETNKTKRSIEADLITAAEAWKKRQRHKFALEAQNIKRWSEVKDKVIAYVKRYMQTRSDASKRHMKITKNGIDIITSTI